MMKSQERLKTPNIFFSFSRFAENADKLARHATCA